MGHRGIEATGRDLAGCDGTEEYRRQEGTWQTGREGKKGAAHLHSWYPRG